MTEFKVPEEVAPKVKIKGLYEKLGLTPEEVLELRKKRFENAMRLLKIYNLIISHGGNIHKKPKDEIVAKRRAANKVAAKQRRVNAKR
jgi:hypothetical protein